MKLSENIQKLLDTNKYEEAADLLCREFDFEFQKKYLGLQIPPNWGSEEVITFKIKLIRRTKKYEYNYYSSIADTRKFLQTNKLNFPTNYDLICCLSFQEIETFEDFCSNFGYSTDSIKAEKIYRAVLDEQIRLSSIFTREELEIMNEIC